MNPKRLVKIQAALSPEQAALLWLQEARRTGSLAENSSALAKLPLSQSPRSRINRQVATAVRGAMKGQPAEQIDKAVRWAAMQAEFLVLLALKVNEEILHQGDFRRVSLELLLEQVQHRGRWWTDANQQDWLGRFLPCVCGALALKAAVELIEREHFRGNPVLFSDAARVLEDECRLIHRVWISHDKVVASLSRTSVDLNPLRKFLEPFIPLLAKCLIDAARSEMLRTFEGSEAAVQLMRPYWNGEFERRAVETCMRHWHQDP